MRRTQRTQKYVVGVLPSSIGATPAEVNLIRILNERNNHALTSKVLRFINVFKTHLKQIVVNNHSICVDTDGMTYDALRHYYIDKLDKHPTFSNSKNVLILSHLKTTIVTNLRKKFIR